MMSLWFSLAGLLLIAALFIIWPLWRYRKTTSAQVLLSEDEVTMRLAENVRIFREHLAELANNLASHAIDESQFAQLKLELERNLLDDEASLRGLHKKSSQYLGVKVVAVFVVCVMLVGIYFYQKHGSLADLEIQTLQQEKLQQDYQDMVQNRESSPARALELIDRYKARLQEQPDNIQYWFLLARGYMDVSNFAEAVKAYQQVLERDQQSAMIMAELSQALFLRDGNKMNPIAADLAKSALLLEPKNTMALGLAGIDAYSRKDYRAAIGFWQKSVDILGASSPTGQSLSGGIAKAKQAFVEAGGKLDDLTAKSQYAVTLKVSIGKKAKVTADQVVFIYARTWKGSPMPLAINRIKVSDLPKTIVLDETMAMSPMASLATVNDIEVVARISPEGSAQAKAGDWQAKQGPISMKSIPNEVLLEINDQLTAESLTSP